MGLPNTDIDLITFLKGGLFNMFLTGRQGCMERSNQKRYIGMDLGRLIQVYISQRNLIPRHFGSPYT